jgi:hypothetical protein
MAAMTDTPAEIPAGLNGSAPGTATPAKQTAEGVSAIAGMLSQFPQVLAGVLQQVPVQTRQHVCCPCLLARLNWEAAHEREMRAAIEAAANFAGLGEQDPRRAQLDPAPFLPEHLQPGAGTQGLPPLTVAATTVGGTDVCPLHIPGRTGGKQLLLASGPLNSALLASLG